MAHRIKIDSHPLARGVVKVEGDRAAVEHVAKCYEIGRIVLREYAGDWKRAVRILRREP